MLPDLSRLTCGVPGGYLRACLLQRLHQRMAPEEEGRYGLALTVKICPVCRKEIRRHGLHKETKFQETVAALSALQEMEVYTRYRERVRQYRLWKQSRGIK